LPRRLGGSPCLLPSGARCLGCGSRLLAGDTRCLGGVPGLLSFLSDGFEHFAMMVANLTYFFRQLPELLRLISGTLRGGTVLFRKPADLGIVMAAIHHITSMPAYHQGRTSDVLNRTNWQRKLFDFCCGRQCSSRLLSLYRRPPRLS